MAAETSDPRSARVQDLLAICRLLTVFDSFDTEAEAIASFPVAGA